MKTLIYSVVMFLVALSGVNTVHSLDDACNITDKDGRVIRSPDCFGALLRVETDQYMYVPIRPEGFVESAADGLPDMYFAAPGCQGEALLYASGRTQGYFFEPVQWVNGTHFLYAERKAIATEGTAILSYWNQVTCEETPEGWGDALFAPLAFKLRSAYSYKCPCKLTRFN